MRLLMDTLVFLVAVAALAFGFAVAAQLFSMM